MQMYKSLPVSIIPKVNVFNKYSFECIEGYIRFMGSSSWTDFDQLCALCDPFFKQIIRLFYNKLSLISPLERLMKHIRSLIKCMIIIRNL